MSIQDLKRRLVSPLTESRGEECLSLLTGQVAWLEEQCSYLIRSLDARISFTATPSEDEDEVSRLLARISGDAWKLAVDAAQSHADDQSSRIQEESNDVVRRLSLRRAVLVARLLRNATADNPQGQQICFSVVSSAITILWRTTSFALEQDTDVHLLSRTLAQMLANLVTANEQLQARLWDEHLDMAGKNSASFNERPPSDLLCRLLASPDMGTQTATQVLLVNMTLSSCTRAADVAQSTVGADVMRALLHTIHTHLEADEDDDEADEKLESRRGDDGVALPSSDEDDARRQRYEGLGILYAFFANLFARGQFDTAFSNLRSITPEDSSIDASLISSAQVTILKLLDSYLHFGKRNDEAQEDENEFKERSKDDLKSLTKVFVHLASWADATMTGILKQANNSRAPVDSRLVEVHVGLILVLQCLNTLAIATEKDNAEPAHERLAITGELLLTEMRTDAFITTLLSLMRSTHAFSPAVSPFVAAAAAEQDKRARHRTTTAPLPEGHVLSSTGQAALAAEAGGKATPRPRLGKLKRDQVSLLGVIAYRRGAHDAEVVRRVQDIVRERGGLLDVLNLTQLDEHNPYIRERAIFALRNLLQGNVASQGIIAQLKPIDPETQAA